MACDYHRLVAACGYVILVSRFVFLHLLTTFIFVGYLDGQNIYDQRKHIKSMVVSMLLNLNHRYSSHNNNIKCVGRGGNSCSRIVSITGFLQYSPTQTQHN